VANQKGIGKVDYGLWAGLKRHFQTHLQLNTMSPREATIKQLARLLEEPLLQHAVVRLPRFSLKVSS
jgi:hypothetical protein